MERIIIDSIQSNICADCSGLLHYASVLSWQTPVRSDLPNYMQSVPVWAGSHHNIWFYWFKKTFSWWTIIKKNDAVFMKTYFFNIVRQKLFK